MTPPPKPATATPCRRSCRATRVSAQRACVHRRRLPRRLRRLRRALRQVLTESLVLASIGGITGVALAPALMHALIAVYPDALPRADEVGISLPVLLVAAVATFAAGVSSAIPAAQRVARLDLADDLRDGGRSGGGRRERRAVRALVVTQVAASLALLFSAGLLMQTFWKLTKVKPGFEPGTRSLFTSTAERPLQGRDVDRPLLRRRHRRAVDDPRCPRRLQHDGAAIRQRRSFDSFIQEERGDQQANNPSAIVSVNTPDFERALGISLRARTLFTPQDDSSSEHVAMINEVLARRIYPGQDPVGRLSHGMASRIGGSLACWRRRGSSRCPRIRRRSCTYPSGRRLDGRATSLSAATRP